MMSGSLAGLDVEGMIYLNLRLANQTLPNHQLSEAVACGPGRDGVRGAEQPATTAAKVHPSPREGGVKSEL